MDLTVSDALSNPLNSYLAFEYQGIKVKTRCSFQKQNQQSVYFIVAKQSTTSKWLKKPEPIGPILNFGR